MERISDAYAELLSRDFAKQKLMDMVNSISLSKKSNINAEEEIRNDFLAAITLCQSEFQKEFSRDEVETLDNLSTMIDVKYTSDKQLVLGVDVGRVYTPNGTAVTYLSKICSHTSSDYHTTQDKAVAAAHGVTVVSAGNCKYNCHSYAWYSQLTSNIMWIDNPSAYMTDGSYTKIMGGNLSSSSSAVVSGNRIFYGTTSSIGSAHSAIITDGASGVPIATRMVRSKWGAYGVFSHTVTNVLDGYNKSTISAWRR